MHLRRSLIFFTIGLILITTGIYWDQSVYKEEEVLLSKINERIGREIGAMDDEAKQLLERDTLTLSGLKHSFFVMDSTQVLKWNKNSFLPDLRTVQDNFSIRLLQWPRGIFILRKWNLPKGEFLLGVLPLQNKYKINNRYLVSGWDSDLFLTQDVSVSDGGGGQPFIWDGRTVFKLQLTNSTPQRYGINGLALALMAMGIIFLAFGSYLLTSEFHKRKKYGFAFIFLIVFFVGGRIISLIFTSSPDLPIFDPSFFASSSYNRSIGDLLINAICIVIPVTYLFYNYHRLNIVQWTLSLQGNSKSIASVLLLLLSTFSILFPFLFFETIFHNSGIPLDITQTLSLTAVRITSFLAVIIGCVTSFMLVHLFLRLAMGLNKRNEPRLIFHLIPTLVIFVLISFLLQRNYWITTGVAGGYLLLISLLNLPKSLKRISYTSFIYLFVAIIALAIQGAISIRKFVIEDKVNAQFRFANAFLIDRDYLGEFLLSESIQRISSDPFIQTRLGSPFLSKSVVRQKVKQVYLNSYFDRYEIQIHLFNASGEAFDNSTSNNLASFVNGVQPDANRTNYDGVYFLKNSIEETGKQYLAIAPINRFGVVIGYVVLDLTLKRVIPRNVFPELLLDDRFIQYFKNRDFSYAFYTENRVISSFGDFNYETIFLSAALTNPDLFSHGFREGNYIHIGVEDGVGNVTIVSSPEYPFFYMVTNFSFLFILGLLIILLGLLIYGITTFYNQRELNYSARIQLYVYLAFILPLVMVSATTLGLINRSAETQLKEEFINKSKTIGDRLAPSIDSYLKNDNTTNEFENQLIDLARLSNVDASVFSREGKLVASSQPLIYEDRILSSLINRDAFDAIVAGNQQYFIANEQIGSLKYNSAYFGMRSPESGALIGILSLPFFESAYSLEKTQISVVANIITIFCIVFILFSILSFFAVRWLTFPLEFITKTLRKTTFMESNKPLVWNANDEIGLMVSEYNKMVDNLEQSKIELSRIQKESAWREIAKQVAHEVKNPLTPMKLTLQQMERSLLSGDLTKERIEKSIQGLLQQVEILNDIASSFSAFARMPSPLLQRIELIALLKRVVNLHSDYEVGSINFKSQVAVVYVMGDGQLLSRIFSNIVLNALQSGDEGKKIQLDVNAVVRDNTCIVSFTDNGGGIDKELSEKVFLPHFSTKKSGSGLGLAIAKQGVEQNGGVIRFETRQGIGTTFYVELPVTA